MNALVLFIKGLSLYLKHLGLCGNTGFISGCFSGIILTILDMQYARSLAFSLAEFYEIYGMLVSFCWIVIIFLFVFLAKFKFSQIAIPSFITVLLVVFLTVFLSWKWDLFEWAWLIRMLIGVMIGYLLCRFSKLFK